MHASLFQYVGSFNLVPILNNNIIMWLQLIATELTLNFNTEIIMTLYIYSTSPSTQTIIILYSSSFL